MNNLLLEAKGNKPPQDLPVNLNLKNVWVEDYVRVVHGLQGPQVGAEVGSVVVLWLGFKRLS